ncbi:MAG: GNAT family N-acetyltransferase [Hyphomicrobiaceae bacterium]|nr:GNAT family N-acetyltransferase [Hyphomicrobiaceae bacterium]
MMVPVLDTERLRLREWREADLPAFVAFYADASTGRFLTAPTNPGEAWRRIALHVGHWSLRGYGAWALEEKASGQWIGYCGLWSPHGWPEPELMWGLAPAARGRGYATEAAHRARDFAYGQLGWTTAISCIVPDNIASQRVARRLGASLERSIELNGRPHGIYRHPEPSRSESTDV